MGPEKKTYFIQDAIICLLICAPLMASGYAAHALGHGWIAVGMLWTTLIFLFLTYCPDDDEENP